jgi:hypothetical protein
MYIMLSAGTVEDKNLKNKLEKHKRTNKQCSKFERIRYRTWLTVKSLSICWFNTVFFKKYSPTYGTVRYISVQLGTSTLKQ